MAEAKRTAAGGASGSSILPTETPQASQGEGSAPLVDWGEVRRFLDLIGRGGGEERLVLAVFPPSEGPCIHLAGTLDAAHRAEVERTLRRHPTHALGLVINPAAPQPADWGARPEEQRGDGSPRVWGASNRHISGAVGGWVECDGGLPIEGQERLPELAGLPEPTLTVWSGGKSLHQYWLTRQRERLAAEAFRPLQRGLKVAIEEVSPAAGADGAVSNPARVMRLPGGLHPKTGDRCRIHSSNGPRYGAEELEQLIPAAATSASSTSSSSGSSSPWSPPSMGSGLGWFDRRTPQQQEELAVAMLRHAPLRTEAGKGVYGECFGILAGLVHQFGPDTAAAICDRAGWRSAAWDPASRVHGIGASDQQAGIGKLIAVARGNGWRHPLAEEEERLVAEFPAIEEPTAAAVVITEEAGGTSSSSPPRKGRITFAQRWGAMEAAADRMAASEEPGVRVAAELAETASELELRLSRRDLETLLEQAQRRLRPGAAPILPGGRFRVRPALWAVEGLVRHGLNLLTGAPGAGKTRFALGCAAAWLKGESSFLGLDLPEAKPVEERELLVVGPDQDLTDWVVALEPLGLATRIDGEEVALHPRVTLHSMETGILLDGDGLATVRRWCDQHPGGLVVADCLAQLLPSGADEDKAGAARPVHALAEALGSCWGLLLHHTRKAAGRERNVGIGSARGSSAIEAAVSRVLSLGLLHRKEGGEWVAMEGDDRRELISTKRGGPTVHLVVRSDANGIWHNEGSAEELRRQERRQSALGNLTEQQREILAVLEEATGQSLVTRAVVEGLGDDWQADREAGGKRAAMVRKVLRRLGDLGLVETSLVGNERCYRLAAATSSSSPSGFLEIDAEPEGGAYESPERLADLREERIPQHVREERDADRLWEAQHRRRTEQEEHALELAALVGEEQLAPAHLPRPALTLKTRPPVPEVGEEIELANGHNGWVGGWIVERVTDKELIVRREGSRKTATRRLDASPPKWRRPDPTRQQQTLLLAA